MEDASSSATKLSVYHPVFDSILAAIIHRRYGVVEAAARFGFRTSQLTCVKILER
jgi:hypothetical protein